MHVTYSATKKFIFVYSLIAKLALLKYANTIASKYYNSKKFPHNELSSVVYTRLYEHAYYRPTYELSHKMRCK